MLPPCAERQARPLCSSSSSSTACTPAQQQQQHRRGGADPPPHPLPRGGGGRHRRGGDGGGRPRACHGARGRTVGGWVGGCAPRLRRRSPRAPPHPHPNTHTQVITGFLGSGVCVCGGGGGVVDSAAGRVGRVLARARLLTCSPRGAGKTTLLNQILRGGHGHRIAVIENEFGEVDIDSEVRVHVCGAAGRSRVAACEAAPTPRSWCRWKRR